MAFKIVDEKSGLKWWHHVLIALGLFYIGGTMESDLGAGIIVIGWGFLITGIVVGWKLLAKKNKESK